MLFQNLLGIGVAAALGVNHSYGVLAGSVAFVGGLGSAVAWGAEFAEKGVRAATEVAVIAATVGMTVGNLRRRALRLVGHPQQGHLGPAR